MSNNNTTKIETSDYNSKGISYKYLFTIIFSFIFGMIGLLLFQRLFEADSITFSTLDLITLVFSVTLSGASIVLAISAISLGKISEKAMVDRSDESIRLQNDIFVKTTEALKSIESSTGVTEKRIEDIISGRAGDISEDIVENVLNNKFSLDSESLQNEIKRTLLSEISSTKENIMRKEEFHKKREARNELTKELSDFQDKLLLDITNLNNIDALKIGNGKNNESGYDLMDGVFKYNNDNVFAITILSAHELLQGKYKPIIIEYINKVGNEIINKTFNKAFIVLVHNNKDHYAKEINLALESMKDDISKNIHIISGDKSEILNNIKKTINYK